MHRRLVYIYLLNVPSFSSRYFNKIKRTSRLGRLLALSLEILLMVNFVILITFIPFVFKGMGVCGRGGGGIFTVCQNTCESVSRILSINPYWAILSKTRLLFSSAEMFKKPLWQTVWTHIYRSSLFWVHAVCFYT